MNAHRWNLPRKLQRIFATPPPEPTQQAARILSIQRNILLPIRALVACGVFYYIFYVPSLSDLSSPRAIVLVTGREMLQEAVGHYFIFYIVISGVAALLLTLKRFPFHLAQWVVFFVGLLDGLLLAGLTAEKGGFESSLFWVFPGLIMVNALSIPLAVPQIVLNLSLAAFYIGAGLLDISITDHDNQFNQLPAKAHHLAEPTFLPVDITNLAGLAGRLNAPEEKDPVSQYVRARLSDETKRLLSSYDGGSNLQLKHDLADDFNAVMKGEPIYDSLRFSGVKLSEPTKLLLRRPQPADTAKLNRALLLDAYAQQISRGKSSVEKTPFMMLGANEELPATVSPESFILRLSILLLMTASCYGVQVLSFRQQIAEQEAQKSAAKNDELMAAGRLAAEIAHQLKNPLGIINNAVYSLQRGLKEGRNDFKLQLEIVREEIEKSDRILTQLMGYAQLSEGRVERLNLAEELDRAIADVLPPGTGYTTQIHREYDPNLPSMVMQRSHLSAVLVNLLQNSREALGGRGNIRLSARKHPGNRVEIIVADDGPGIPSDKLDKIFEAYVTTKAKGTGLGLAIVKHNVELYGGRVRVESELGKGARFILSFPAKTFIVTGP